MKRLHEEDVPAPRVRPLLRGALLLLLSMLIVPFMDAAAKYLGMHGHHALQVTWLRMIMQFAIVAPVAVRVHGARAVFRARRPHLLLLRGFFLLGATICFFTAIQVLPLVDTVAITFTEPVVLLVLSATWLRETVRPSRWVAGIVGFGAVVLIVKPGSSSFQPAALVAMLCSVFFSLYLLSTRALQTGTDPAPTLILLAYQCLPGSVTLAAVMPFVWSPFASVLEVMLGLSMGAIGVPTVCPD